MKEQNTNYSPVVSIIGRPNVGKSTVFNRLMRKSTKALTHDEPGVTRDRHYGVAKLKDHHKYADRDLIMVDTGGFYPEKVEENEKNADKFFNIMADHAKLAIDESDLILFVVDVREGLLPFDETITNYLRSTQKPFWLLVNKYDSENQAGDEAEFYTLGVEFTDTFVISSAHGRGFDDLLDRLHGFVVDLDKRDTGNLGIQYGVKPQSEVVGSLAIIGAPNAGKSTLLNQLVGTERALVSNIAGTTVDPIEGYIEIDFRRKVKWLKTQKNEFLMSDQDILDQYDYFQNTLEETTIAYHGEVDSNLADFSALEEQENDEMNARLEEKIFGETQESEEVEETIEEESSIRSLKIIDTAGIRRQKSVKGFIETQSVYRSLRCISDSDIVILVMDATKGISHQDRRLCDIALEKGKSIILCLNKIDLLKEKIRDTKDRREWIQDLRDTIPWLSYCELITISAKYKRNIKGLKNSIVDTMVVRSRPLPTSSLNKCIYQLVDKNPIVVKGSRGKPLKVKYASMVKADPPTFLMYSNKSKDIPPNFRRYIQNGLRKEFDLRNTPVHLIFRTNKDLELREKSRQ